MKFVQIKPHSNTDNIVVLENHRGQTINILVPIDANDDFWTDHDDTYGLNLVFFGKHYK